MTATLAYLATLTVPNVLRMGWGRLTRFVAGEWFPAGVLVSVVAFALCWALWSHFGSIRRATDDRDAHWQGELAKTNASAAQQQLERERAARRREAEIRARWEAERTNLSAEIVAREQLIAKLRAKGKDPVLSRYQIRLFRRGEQQ